DLYPDSEKYYDKYVNYRIEKINANELPSDGNINALLVTWNQRNYADSKVTNWATRGITVAMEKYDDIPYQLKSDDVVRTDLDKLNQGKSALDTLIAPSNSSYFYDYSLTGSGNRALMVSSINGLSSSSGPSDFYYQEVKLTRQRADSFAVDKVTPAGKDAGIVIGIGTGNDRFPAFAGDGAGNATFYYVGPNGRDFVKASPVGEGGKLLWGALGLPLNSGGVAGSYYNPSSAFMYMDADGKGVIAWNDGRKTPDGYTGQNVYVRHLDNLLNSNYQPPLLNTTMTVIPANPNAAGNSFAQSGTQSLIGTSNAWTTFQVPVAGPTSNTSTPVAAIRDDYNLGTVSVSTYDFYNQAPRQTDGHAYLDRNYTINVTNHPAGASIHVRLIFTKAQFDAMKAKDPTIQDPGSLKVKKQPSTGVAPASYTPSSDDKDIQPVGWGTLENTVGNQTVIGGYYLEIVIDGFSNFFIMGGGTPLPVTWQSFTVKAVDKYALLQWATAMESNNDHFDIERSADGIAFTKIGRIAGNGTTSIPQHYQFTDAAPLSSTNYYRLAQVDLDGKIDYSTIRVLQFSAQTRTMQLSPNPAKSTVHIVLPQAASGQHTIELYHLSGRKVLVQSVPAGTVQLDVDISTLAAGMYIIRYGDSIMKVVKQ
ncbi:MAG: T9SS type A sorting domain-containing protein, partial [Bacteroidetes bacterium]|nr:T9SS type A sorting domain-containing protein [Bacteroidota bacterium]